MDPQAADAFSKELMKAMRRHLEIAASVAKAGVACARAGSPARAIEIVIDLGDDLHEVNRLFEAAVAVSKCRGD